MAKQTMLFLVTVDNLFTGEIVRQYVFMGDEESCIMHCCNDQDSRFYPFQIKPYRKLVSAWPQN